MWVIFIDWKHWILYSMKDLLLQRDIWSNTGEFIPIPQYLLMMLLYSHLFISPEGTSTKLQVRQQLDTCKRFSAWEDYPCVFTAAMWLHLILKHFYIITLMINFLSSLTKFRLFGHCCDVIFYCCIWCTIQNLFDIIQYSGVKWSWHISKVRSSKDSASGTQFRLQEAFQVRIPGEWCILLCFIFNWEVF